MTVRLGNEDYRRLIDILKRLPGFDSRSERMARWLRPAFQGQPRGEVILDAVPAAGDDNEVAASNIVTYLATQFGQIETGVESLGVFLTHVAGKVGQEQAEALEAMIEAYDMLGRGAPPGPGGEGGLERGATRPHFLDSLPLDWTHPGTNDLHALLSEMYWREEDAVQLLRRVGMPPGEIRWRPTMTDAWADILEKARNRDKLRPLLALVREDERQAAYHARLDELLGDSPVVSAPSPGGLDWRGAEPAEEGELERLLGRNSLLDIAFLAEGLRRGKAVARVTATFSAGDFYGTASLIGDDLVLTNHHVLFNQQDGDEPAREVELWFDYARTFGGAEGPCLKVPGRVETIVGDKARDWAVVRLTRPMPEDYPRLALGGEVKVNDRVYIIQHPDGLPKQIGMHDNLVRHVDADVVQYMTDTMHGSSGSPVFNGRWQVVALHNQWVLAGGKFRKEYRNQGIAIGRVIEGLKERGLLPEASQGDTEGSHGPA